RILIGLHNAKSAWELPWNDQITYGDVRRQEEFEHSKYYFEVADVPAMRETFERFEREAEACLAQGLVLPAHDYVLKCSHLFNILDTRGAVSLTERQAVFRRIRELARRTAETYLEQRKALEYPMLKESREQRLEISKPDYSPISNPQTLLFEIGVEELPASDVDSAREFLSARVPNLLTELHLAYEGARIFATPRRLVVAVDSLAPNQPDREDLVKGPPADKALVGQVSDLPTPFVTGQVGSLSYTKAAEGFAKKNNVRVEDLEVREQDGGKYVFAVVKQKGRPAPDVLAEALPKLVAEIKFEKSMRWNDSGVAFSRPIRWYVALFGETVIPFEYAGVVSGNVTRGLRPYDSPEIVIPSADKYFELIREAGIILDIEERKSSIVEQVNQAASLIGGQAIFDFVGASQDSPLLNEVANLVEMPTAVMGGFDPEFLQLPKDVLISVMKKHQRYFPVANPSTRSGQADQSPITNYQLLPHFIAIRNGDDLGVDLVRQGNEHVLGARFADANFFVREDLKLKLEAYRPKLAALTFQTKLGSMLDKSDRMLKLGAEVGRLLGFKGVEEIKPLGRAVYLAKADLATQMVTEMTSLQGIIGGEYALRSGETPEVAQAIAEQYQPVPRSKIGVAVALTDRIDSLVGLFAAGLAPTGAKDPFGLRRAAIGVVQPLIEHDLDFDLAEAVNRSAKLQPIEVKEEVKAQVLEFIAGRLKVLLGEMGFKHDVVEAILAAQSNNPAGALRAVKQLQEWVKREDWSNILDGFARCVRIIRAASITNHQLPIINEQLFEAEEEKKLYQALNAERSTFNSVDDFLAAVKNLIPSITAFFDKVMVMAEDEKVRQNRLALVGQVSNLSKGMADLSKLEGF
ncbi:MAG: glycine--tRNA ligase subunit beta, partial [Chloroflexi bacterium]|nr:glycine--tRNA ligase subunit beta [Chloroflexota bacterium]